MDEIRILTDARLPFAAVVGQPGTATDVQQLRDALARHLMPVSDVYNCSAYSLNRECTDLAIVHGDGRVLIVYLVPSPIALEGKDKVPHIDRRIGATIRAVSSILEQEGLEVVEFESFVLGYTERQSN